VTQKRAGLIPFLLLAISAALSVSVYAVLRAAGNKHATVWYLVVLYGLVLPAVLFYWRSDRDATSANVEISWPRLHLPAIAIFAILAIFLSQADEHGRLIPDESAYMFQARVFAAGELKARAMPGAEASTPHDVPAEIYFEQTIQRPDGWFTKYPPGWPLLLALGYLVHLPWLVNPMLGLAQLAIAWWIAGLWGRNTQILTIVIAATSSFMLASSVGCMAHAVGGTICLLALGALLKGIDEKKVSWISLCFVLVVASTEVRSYTGAVFGLLCAGICLYEYRKDWPFLLRTGLIAGTAGTASVVLLLFTNWLFTGHPLLSPYALAQASRHPQEMTFSPALILNNALYTTRWAITTTIQFTFPFMFLLAAYACVQETRCRRLLIYCALFFPLLVFAYLQTSFFPFMLQNEGSGSINGERYYFEGFCAVAIVAARGFELLAQQWKVRSRAVLAAMAVMLCLQAANLVFTTKDIEKVFAPYRKAYLLAHSAPLMPLVFVSGNEPEFTSKHVNWNDADWWKAPTIYLNDPGPGRRRDVTCRFGRASYRVVQYLPESKAFSKDDVLDVCSEPSSPGSQN
jgi:hypothetical protein